MLGFLQISASTIRLAPRTHNARTEVRPTAANVILDGLNPIVKRQMSAFPILATMMETALMETTLSLVIVSLESQEQDVRST